MFWKKDKLEISKLKSDIEILKKQYNQYKLDLEALNRILKEQDISIVKEVNQVNRELGNVVFSLKNEIAKKLIDFEKEITGKISDRYYFLEKYVSGDNKILSDLRRTIIQPILDAKANEELKLKGAELDNTIKNNSQFILEKRKALWEEKLQLERLEKDSREVSAQIRMIDFIIGGAK